MMKRSYAVSFSLAVVALLLTIVVSFSGGLVNLAEGGGADQGFEERYVSVDGIAFTEVPSDVAIIVFHINNEGSTPSEALEKVSLTSNTLLEELKKIGIKEEEITKSRLSVYPKYIYPRDGEPIIVGYVASYVIEVRTKALNKVGEAILEASKLGITNIWLSYTVSKELSLSVRKELISIAIQDAKERADAALSSLGLKVGGVKSIIISDEYTPLPIPKQITPFLEPESQSIPVQPGIQTFTVKVKVVFLIE